MNHPQQCTGCKLAPKFLDTGYYSKNGMGYGGHTQPFTLNSAVQRLSSFTPEALAFVI